MNTLKNIVTTAIGKVLIGVIAILIGVIISISFYTLSVSGERNVLKQMVKTKEAETARQKDNVAFYKAWMERDKLDNKTKDEAFNRKMATKPKFVTQIKYVPTGNNCVDLNAIIDEARGANNAK